MLDGLMTISKLDNGLNALEFACIEQVKISALSTKCSLQVMRDGNVYITELPRRVRNRPLFREDNSSLTLGRDGRYYFVFSFPADQVALLSDELIRQAEAITLKLKETIVKFKTL